MKLVATMLCGPNIDDTIDRAIASIKGHVDEIVTIETTNRSRTWPGTVTVIWPWIGAFDAARNEALAVAIDLGADWAITLDADEWWTGAELIRGLCESADPKTEALYFKSSGNYWQPRAIRLPCQKRWQGRTHEALAVSGVKHEGPVFHEDPKTPAQIQEKAIRDSEMLLKLIVERPDEPRWRYYLGESYIALELWEEAVQSFLACANMHGWYEERAMAMLRAAEVTTTKLHDHDGAIEILASAMASHAGIAEIPWLAAIACMRAGKTGQALYWARLAQVHGEGGADNAMALQHRLLPLRFEALRDGPQRIIDEIYESMGWKAGEPPIPPSTT